MCFVCLHVQSAKSERMTDFQCITLFLSSLLTWVSILKATSLSTTDTLDSLAIDGCGPDPGTGTLTQVNTPYEALAARAMDLFDHIQSLLNAF